MFIDCSDSCVVHFKCCHSIDKQPFDHVYNNAWHTGDHILKARSSTSNVISNRNCVTKGILTSSTTSNGIVYIGSQDGNVYALNAVTWTKMWNYTTGDWVLSSPTVVNGIV